MIKRVVGTVITKSFLAHARTLAESLTEHNPDIELYVLLADRVDDYFEPSAEPFHLIQLTDLPEQDIVERMCFYYTPFELCCALRGYLHEYIFNHTSAESWLFLDADIMIFHSLERIFEQLEKTSILLTPHVQTLSAPHPGADLDIVVLNAGLYNAGFVGLRRGKEVFRFITWFKDRLQDYCFNDIAVENLRGLFVDQRWLNLVPLYFREVSFLLDPGANLGHWNLYERALDLDQTGNVTVNQQPVFFVHFSGWDIDNPERVSKYNTRYDNLEIPVWKSLSTPYQNKLLKNNYETIIHYPCAFDSFDNGQPISLEMRQMYYDDLIKGVIHDKSPFANPGYFHERSYIPSESKALLREKVVRSQEYINHLHNELMKAQDWLAQTQAMQAQSQELQAQTQVELFQLQTHMSQTQADLSQTQADLSQTQADLSQTQADLSQTQTALTQLRAELEEIKGSKLWTIREGWRRFKRIISLGRNG